MARGEEDEATLRELLERGETNGVQRLSTPPGPVAIQKGSRVRIIRSCSGFANVRAGTRLWMQEQTSKDSGI